jgi:hypothetical protein
MRSIHGRPWAAAARTTAAACLSWCIFASLLALARADSGPEEETVERSVLKRVAHRRGGAHQRELAGVSSAYCPCSYMSCACEPACCQPCAKCACVACECAAPCPQTCCCCRCKQCGCAPSPRDLFRRLFKRACCCQPKCGCQSHCAPHCEAACGCPAACGCGNGAAPPSGDYNPRREPPPETRVTPRTGTSLFAPPSDSEVSVPARDKPPARSEAFFRKEPPQPKPMLKQERKSNGPEPPPFLSPLN